MVWNSKIGIYISRVLTILVLLVGVSSCIPRYTLNGAAIDYNVYKTIRVGEFPIRAAMAYATCNLFENKLIDTYTKQTRLKITDSSNSDLAVEGEITGYSLSPQAVGEDAFATKTRLTITVRVKYVDNKEPRNTIDQTFSAFRRLDANEMLTSVQDELCSQISDELVLLIFNATAGNW